MRSANKQFDAGRSLVENPVRPVWCLLTVMCAAFAFPAIAAEKQGEVPRRWSFNLIPKAFQSNPMMDMTVITEMTDEGRLRSLPSPESPMYYSLLSAGYRTFGEISGVTRVFSQAETEEHLIRSLAAGGFQPEQLDHPATLLIVYSWGVHSPLQEGDEVNSAESKEMIMRNVLTRAALVGGDKFAEELHRMFRQANDMVHPFTGQPLFPGFEFNNPVALFRASSVRNAFLLLQSADSIYYIIASAYDYSNAAENQRVLLWRTRMTVSTVGVSMVESLPFVIETAAPFFGRETEDVQIVQRRVGEGRVSIGDLQVVPPEPEDRKPASGSESR